MSGPSPYDGRTDEQLMSDARKALFDAVIEPPYSIERAMVWARYDAIAGELKRRAARKLSEELGLPPSDI